MKKFMILLVLLVAPAVMLVAQEIEPPSDVFDAVGSFKEYMATFGGLVVLSVFFTGFFNGIFQVLSSTVRLIISWVVPVILALLAGFLLNIGFLAESPWWLIILYGFGAGLVGNRGYDLAIIQQIILFIETLLGNKAVKPQF